MMIEMVHMTKKSTMLNASLCNYSGVYILLDERITVVGQGEDYVTIAADRNNKEIIFKNCPSFIKCISKINNAEADNAEDLHILMPMYNLLDYSENYTKTSASSWQYCRDESDPNITDSKSFKSKSSITDNANNAGITNVKIVVTLSCLTNFWRTLEMQLISCEVTLDLNWSENCVICETDRALTFVMTSAKRYVSTVTL